MNGKIQLVDYRNSARLKRFRQERKYPDKRAGALTLQLNREGRGQTGMLKERHWPVRSRTYLHFADTQIDSFDLAIQRLKKSGVSRVMTDNCVLGCINLLD